MKKIKLRTSTDEWNNIAYYRTFEVWDEEPTADMINDDNTQVIKITPYELDCEERNAADYNCYKVICRVKEWDKEWGEDDEEDVLYIAVPVEYDDFDDDDEEDE